jgi:Right handed beta helix region
MLLGLTVPAGVGPSNEPPHRIVWRACSLALAATSVVILAVLPSRAAGETREIGPDTDFCAAANALAPGDELVLGPGDYQAGCTIRNGGTRGAPIVIRASDPANPPQLVFTAKTNNVVNVAANAVVLRGLHFGPTQTDVDGVRIRSGDDITVDSCVFTEIGGVAIVANASTQRLTLSNNEIRRSKTTAVYLGCHDGAGCRVTDAVVEGNHIEGVQAPYDQIGYGIQVKLNSAAVIRDNVIIDIKGPGIMVYGARDPALTSTVARNFVASSRTSSGIVVGGGPAVVVNNIAVRNAQSGIALEDYGKRGLLRRIVLSNNTVYGGVEAGISVPATQMLDAKLLYNASHSLAGTALPGPRAGIIALGNIDCRSAPCFADPLAMNFTPMAGSPLIGRALQGVDVPREDFFGVARPPLAAVGAIESGGSDRAVTGKKPRVN